MTQVTFIEPNGSTRNIDVPEGWSLMNAATAHGIEGMEAGCGGSCACATCHCYVEQGHDALPPPADNELAMLDAVSAERRNNSRLACQLKPRAGLVVRMPDCQ